MKRWQNESIQEAPWNRFTIGDIIDVDVDMEMVNDYDPRIYNSRGEDDIDMDVPDVSLRKTTTATDGESTKGENGSAYEWS
jgi:hypothetical protein